MKRGYRKYVELAIPGVLGLAILAVIPMEVNIHSEAFSNSTSPRLFPELVAFLMIALSVGQLILLLTPKWRERAKVKQGSQDESQTVAQIVPEKKEFSIRTGVLVAYVCVIPLLGFLISTILFLFTLVTLLGKVKWYFSIPFSLIVAFPVWVLFHYILSVPLPKGVLGL